MYPNQNMMDTEYLLKLLGQRREHPEYQPMRPEPAPDDMQSMFANLLRRREHREMMSPDSQRPDFMESLRTQSSRWL